jgi:hypothetical protein
MGLPPSVDLRVRDASGHEATDLIFSMLISTGRKNPYSIYFPKTDAHGRAFLSARAVRGQFEDHWAEALMDHSGTLDEARQDVTFVLFDPKRLRENIVLASASPLLPYEKTVWASRAQRIDYLLSCRNELYRFEETIVAMPRDGLVELQVSPAHGA